MRVDRTFLLLNSHPKNLSQLSNNIEGTAGGTIATVLGASIGWLDANTLTEAIMLAVIGAVIGFLTNKLMKWAERKIQDWRDKPRTKRK